MSRGDSPTIGWVVFHFGGWRIVWGKNMSIFEQIFMKPSLVFKVNKLYYGFDYDNRFFDSPFIQCIMLGIGIITMAIGIRKLITGKYFDKD